MEKFGKSQPVKRVEDVRFLTGQGRYVDDIAPEGALQACVFRSPVAHAVITGLDLEAARAADGVHLVLTSEDLLAAGITQGLVATVLTNRDGTKAAAPRRPILAEGRLRFVGEPIALIVADTAAQARDAAELIVLDYDDLPAKLDLMPGGQALHDEAPDNRAFDWSKGDEAACDAAFAKAARVVRLEVEDNRIIVNAMEPRGCFAEWTDGRLHLAVNGQGVWVIKRHLSEILGLSPDNVRVTNPDVGGGFGMKSMSYPESFAVAHAARVLDRPVRWMSERTEAMLTDNAGRDLVHEVSLAFDADHRILAYRVETRCNLNRYWSGYDSGRRIVHNIRQSHRNDDKQR